MATTPTYIAVTEGAGKKLAAVTYTENGQVVLDQKVIQGEPYLHTYGVELGPSTATVNAHLLQIMAGASLNVRILYISAYLDHLATTATIGVFGLYRLTSAGSGGGAVTPVPFDLADSGAGATVMGLPSSKGTEGALLWDWEVNMPSALPTNALIGELFNLPTNLLRGKQIVIPAGTSNGLAIKNLAAVAAGVLAINVIFTEASF